MAKYTFTYLDGYDRLRTQTIDTAHQTTVIMSKLHPRKGDVVNTVLFLEAVSAYVERQSIFMQSLKSYNPKFCTIPSNHINAVDVLKIYYDLLAHEFEKIERVIMEAFYG
jgi:hypothetical protein